jgi:hypothetical protein
MAQKSGFRILVSNEKMHLLNYAGDYRPIALKPTCIQAMLVISAIDDRYVLAF